MSIQQMFVMASRPVGQINFTTPGTHSWTCPADVTSVCAVCIGGGGNGWGEYGGTQNNDLDGGSGGGRGSDGWGYGFCLEQCSSGQHGLRTPERQQGASGPSSRKPSPSSGAGKFTVAGSYSVIG